MRKILLGRLLLVALAISVSNLVRAATYTVTNTADSGEFSLRWAIDQVNAGSGGDTINFKINQTPAVISLVTQLPTITRKVRIDGYANGMGSENTLDFGNNAVLNVVLKGVASTFDGLTINTATQCEIRGLVFNAFNRAIVLNNLTGDSPKTHTTVIKGNFIGVDSSGKTAAANKIGIEASNCAFIRVIGNVISGNTSNGVKMSKCTGGVLFRNLLGTDAVGKSAIPNIGNAIHLDGCTGFRIGKVAGPNLISGNYTSGKVTYGVYLKNSSLCSIAVNLMGLDITGANMLRNYGGITVEGGANNIIGPSNFITGNVNVGIYINASTSCVIKGNKIGVDVNGKDRAPGATENYNKYAGVYVYKSSSITVGGDYLRFQGNVIAGNDKDAGVVFHTASDCKLTGNLIGINSYGESKGNGSGVFATKSSNLTIGGSYDTRNIISQNHSYGLRIYESPNCSIKANFIGTDDGGTIARPNGCKSVDPYQIDTDGLWISQEGCSGLQVGGPKEERNTISGNVGHGIKIVRSDPNAAVANIHIASNYIGTTGNGKGKLSNGKDGVYLEKATYVVIGNDQTNTISGNAGYGVRLKNASYNTITNNYIGLSSDGKNVLANTKGTVAYEENCTNNKVQDNKTN